MIPVLYKENETEFTTNGIGRLSDTTKCVVSEERNGIFELELTYPVTGLHYDDIKNDRIIYAYSNDYKKAQAFRIYKITKPLSGIITVYAEHISYQLNCIPCKPFSATSCAEAINKIKSNVMADCPFEFYTDKNTEAQLQMVDPVSVRAELCGHENSLVDVYGGELEFDNWNVRLTNNRGIDKSDSVVIKYGKNLTDVTQEESIAETYTAIFPYFKKDNGNGTFSFVYATDGVLKAKNADKFNFERINIVDLSSDQSLSSLSTTTTVVTDGNSEVSTEARLPTPEEVQKAGEQYLASRDIGVPAVNLNVSFVALWQTEEYKDIAPLQRVNLCDTVTVRFDKLGVNVKAKVTKTNYNVLLERYDNIELSTVGDVRSSSLTKTFSDNEKKVEEYRTAMEQAISHAQSMMDGSAGGHIVIRRNPEGQPEEILVLDQADINQAMNVIRINKNGIAFSKDGYKGPYNSAWLIDSTFYADYITAGILNANLIKAGIISDTSGKNFWNMDTGEFQLSKETKVSGGKDEEGNTLSDYVTTATFKTTTDGLESEVSKKIGPDNVISTINQSAETVAINAEKIDLNGVVTANNYFKINTDGSMETIMGKFGNFKLDANGDLIWTKDGSSGDWMIPNVAAGNGYNVGETANSIYFGRSGLGIFKGESIIYGHNRVSFLNSHNQVYGWLRLSYNEVNTYTTGVAICDYSDNVHLVGMPIQTYLPQQVNCLQTLNVSGNKHRVVSTDHYGKRLLSCYEMAEPIFGDMGSGRLDESGVCLISIDDVFQETVRTDLNYLVFLQKEGEGDIWVAEKNRDNFVVKGSPNLSFAWEIKSIQKDFITERLDENVDQLIVDPVDQPEQQYDKDNETTIENDISELENTYSDELNAEGGYF